MRLLIVATLLLGIAASVNPAYAQEAADDYEQQLLEYDQRVAEMEQWEAEARQWEADARQWEAQRGWKRWIPVGVISAVLFIYLVYSQVAARRRYDAVMQQSQQNMDEAVKQNQAMIDLLKSINDRLGQDT